MMNEKRFTIKSTATELELYDNGVKIGEFPHYEWVARPVDYVVKTLNEQQATISTMTEENKELGKNFEDLVDWASKIANRNVVLDEQIGQLQRENEQLRQQLKEKEEDEQLYAKEILELRETNKQWSEFKELGGDY